MKFFLDTAIIDEIRDAAETGLIDGVTTNPSLVAQSGRNYTQVLKEITQIVNGPISAEVLSLDAQGMVEEGKKLAGIHHNIVIKLPMTDAGVLAANELLSNDIHINMTLIFSPVQALICGKLGVDFVSPFIGRLDDVSQSGMDLVSDILTIYDHYGFDTEVLVASVRHPMHVLEAARMGAHIATMPFKVFKQLTKHPLTDIGVQKFLQDAQKIPK